MPHVQVVAPQVFQESQAQKERKVPQAHLLMAAPQEAQAPLDLLDHPALVELQAQEVGITIELFIWEMK